MQNGQASAQVVTGGIEVALLGAVDGGEVVERLDAGGPEIRTHLSYHSLEAGLVEKLLETLC